MSLMMLHERSLLAVVIDWFFLVLFASEYTTSCGITALDAE